MSLRSIVAGGPEQMPPTNFFSRADDDPDGDVDKEGDPERIPDGMLGASIPAITLNLHYRSRHESLIAFSNDRYYGNGLITFQPSKWLIEQSASNAPTPSTPVAALVTIRERRGRLWTKSSVA